MPRCRELSIDEMLADPIVRALMAADRVDPAELRALLRSVADSRPVRSSEPDGHSTPNAKGDPA